MGESHEPTQNIFNTASCASVASLQVPPPGPFDFNSLQWYKKGKYLTCKVPKDRLSDYVAGEIERCHCTFYTTRVPKKKLVPTSKRRDALLSTEVFNCCFGPQTDKGFKLDHPDRKEPGKRRSKKNMGEGIKIGCQAHFRAATYAAEEDVVVLTVYQVRNIVISDTDLPDSICDTC